MYVGSTGATVVPKLGDMAAWANMVLIQYFYRDSL